MKNWLVQKKKKLELAPRRTWKRYWVCLKGTVLLFYDGDIDNVTVEESIPRHMLGKLELIRTNCLELYALELSMCDRGLG